MSEGVGPVGEIRISDADREQATGRLHTALAEGRITLVELDERAGQVYAARFAGDSARRWRISRPINRSGGGRRLTARTPDAAGHPLETRYGTAAASRWCGAGAGPQEPDVYDPVPFRSGIGNRDGGLSSGRRLVGDQCRARTRRAL